MKRDVKKRRTEHLGLKPEEEVHIDEEAMIDSEEEERAKLMTEEETRIV